MAIYRPPGGADDREHGGASPETRLRQKPSSQGGSGRVSSIANSSDRRMSFSEDRHSALSLSIRDFVSANPHMRSVNKFSVLCGNVVNNPNVQLIIIVLIVVNAIMMGVATFDFVTENPKMDDAFEKTDMAFLIVFTIELAMQFVFLGYKLFKDGWLVFDFLIVVLSWSFAGLQIIRAFRIFRALRIITRIETMRNLVTALFDIMPRLGAITALLLLIFYIFAVLFTQLFGELELSGPYFTRLDQSFLTLFVMMTMEWADVARECKAEIWWAWAPFVAFIMITGFIVFNLIIAVVCDAVAVIENKEDLEPDFFAGMMGSKDLEGPMNDSVGDVVDGGGVNAGGIMVDEEQLIDNLAERIASVLNSQKEMLATLDSLTKEALLPSQQPQAGRRYSPHVEDDKMPK